MSERSPFWSRVVSALEIDGYKSMAKEVDAQLQTIRAEAMREAIDLICSEFTDQDPVFQKEIDNFVDYTAPRLRYVIEAAILAREVKE